MEHVFECVFCEQPWSNLLLDSECHSITTADYWRTLNHPTNSEWCKGKLIEITEALSTTKWIFFFLSKDFFVYGSVRARPVRGAAAHIIDVKKQHGNVFRSLVCEHIQYPHSSFPVSHSTNRHVGLRSKWRTGKTMSVSLHSPTERAPASPQRDFCASLSPRQNSRSLAVCFPSYLCEISRVKALRWSKYCADMQHICDAFAYWSGVTQRLVNCQWYKLQSTFRFLGQQRTVSKTKREQRRVK